MHIYAQHGFGKSDKIETGLQGGYIKGVILSPRDEQRVKMEDYVRSLRAEFGAKAAILFDPQFYVTTLASPKDGYLPDYPYYQPGLTRGRFIAPSDIRNYVSNTLNYQSTLQLSRIISATILFNDFRDPWSQISLSMAQEAVSLHKGLKKAPPLLISVVVDEQAFKNRDAVNEYLDIISLWDVQGVYLIVRRTDSTYPASTDESVMANLMYFVYVLSEINGLEVVCGFSDMMGMLLHAAGATATGTGWYNSLKQFTLKRFQPSTGGRAPRARYTSGPLLGSLLIVPELDAAYRLKQVPKVISNTTFDGAFLTRNPGNVEWPASTACLHHWEVLSSLASEFSSQGSVSDNLDVLQEAIKKGIRTYQALERAGVQFELPTIPRDLRTWNTAIDAFRAEVGL